MIQKVAITLALVPILLLPLTNCRGSDVAKASLRDAAKLNSHALQLMAAGNYDSAIEKLVEATELEPDEMTYITNLAFALYHAGRFDEALQQYERALGIDPGDPLVYFDYGLCLRRAGRPNEALPKLLKAAELGSGHSKLPDILYKLAACHEEVGNRAGAISTLQRLVEAAPRPEFYDKLGDLLQAENDLEGAEEAYRQAINISPHYTPAMNSLGLVLSTTGRKEEAHMFYLIVLERDPDNPIAHNNLAMDYWEDGDTDGAIEEIRLAVDADPDNPLYHYHLAQFLVDSGSNEEAISELRTTLQLDPEFTDAQIALEKLGVG